MISDALQKWLIVILITLAMANPQFPMPYPMPGYPSMFPMLPGAPPMSPFLPQPAPMGPMFPPSMNMPMSIGIAIMPDTGSEKKSTTKSTTTTTTTKKPDIVDTDFAIGVPVSMPLPPPIPIPAPMSMPMPAPMPMPGLMPMPAPMPMPSPVVFAVPGMVSPACRLNPLLPSCPPCPPCTCFPCTPSFFSYCSPCHLKCRCRKGQDVPIPLPPRAPYPLRGPAFPMPYPSSNRRNSVVIPFPEQRGKPFLHHQKQFHHQDKGKHKVKCSHQRSKFHHLKHHNEVTSSSEDDSDSQEPSKIINSQSYDQFDLDRSDDMLIKPVLTYVSEDGEIKIRRNLDTVEALRLINDENNSMMNEKLAEYRTIKRHKDMKHEIVNIGPGRKRLIFRPPSDMLVGNLSVSFTT